MKARQATLQRTISRSNTQEDDTRQPVNLPRFSEIASLAGTARSPSPPHHYDYRLYQHRAYGRQQQDRYPDWNNRHHREDVRVRTAYSTERYVDERDYPMAQYPYRVHKAYRGSPATQSTDDDEHDDRLAFSTHPQDGHDRDKWKLYAVKRVSDEGVPIVQCVWRACGYFSEKKSLVKRHIEGTHLEYRPFECEMCGKAFSQKNSLEGHRNGHSGARPHKCEYAGCTQAFGDRAGRHKHMRDKHGYQPRQIKKKPRVGSSDDAFEDDT